MSHLSLSIILAALPSLAVLIISLHYAVDRVRVLGSFIAGYFAVLPALAAELLFSRATSNLDALQGAFFRAFLVAGFVEEGIKLAVVTAFSSRLRDESGAFMRILVAVSAALGFAGFENILYSGDILAVVLVRGVSAVPVHCIASIVMAHMISGRESVGRNKYLMPLLTAIIIHGCYDLLLFLPNPVPYASILYVAAFVPIVRSIIRRAYALAHSKGPVNPRKRRREP